MIDKYKAVFLPVDDRILFLYKGYILDGKMLPNLKKEDVYKETVYYEVDTDKSKTEKIFRYIIFIPFVPIFIIAAIIATLFKKFDPFTKKTSEIIDLFFGFLFKKKKIKKIRAEKSKKYYGVEEEDILDFLDHCKKNLAKVFLYSYQQLSKENSSKVEELIQKGYINSFMVISKISDLQILIESENISLHNTFIVIKDIEDYDEVKELFEVPKEYRNNYYSSNRVELWGEKNPNYSGSLSNRNLSNNCRETLLQMKRNITYYLEAKHTLFLTDNIVFFVEDNFHPVINSYIQNNYEKLNLALAKKGMKLLYYPVLNQNNTSFINDDFIGFIRYKFPIFYELNNDELSSLATQLLNKLSPQHFYKLILEELELPYFQRPALIRQVSAFGEKKFTYSTINIGNNINEIEQFFNWYIEQVKIPKSEVYFQLANKIIKNEDYQYDADWEFSKESKELSNELKNKIDEIKLKGEYEVLAEALMYMLEKIKYDKPELISKVKPLIEKKNLLDKNIVLSSIFVDKNFNITLPEFGNKEVKMYPLPKTVYLLFLKYPEGIRFKTLYQYKKELLEIYNLVTNKGEKDEIEKAIDDLVDMTNPSINQKCARIRESFRNIMDENTAKYYYIDGLNGEEKKISLSQNLISLPHNLTDIRY